jgi:hypothetical protein
MKLTEDIKKYARQTPFRPFLIETASGSRFLVADSYRIAFDENRGRVVVFDADGLVEIIDLDAVQIVTVP